MSDCSYVLLNILINAWRYLLMKKMLFILVSMLCLLLSAGCGSDKQAAQAPAADKVLREATSPLRPLSFIIRSKINLPVLISI